MKHIIFVFCLIFFPNLFLFLTATRGKSTKYKLWSVGSMVLVCSLLVIYLWKNEAGGTVIKRGEEQRGGVTDGAGANPHK